MSPYREGPPAPRPAPRARWWRLAGAWLRGSLRAWRLRSEGRCAVCRSSTLYPFQCVRVRRGEDLCPGGDPLDREFARRLLAWESSQRAGMLRHRRDAGGTPL